MRRRNTYSLHYLNSILFSSCNGHVLFPANNESFHKTSCVVNCTVFHSLTTVIQNTSKFLVVMCSFTMYSWYIYIFLLIALQSKVSTNTYHLLTLYRLSGDETQCYHNWCLAKCLQSSTHQFVCTYETHGSHCFQSESKPTYVTHQPLTYNVLFKVPLLA